MFKVIDVKNNKYIFLPNTLNIYRYNEEIMTVYQKIEHSESKENSDYKIIKKLMDNEERSREYNLQTKLNYYDADTIEIAGCDINLLYECNLRCKYCFVNDNHDNKGGVLSKENAEKILDFIFKHLSHKDYLIITLMGGEPFMNMETFKYILEYGSYLGKIHNKKVEFITTTNAVLLDDERIAILEKYNVGFIMSLDSHIKEVNDYLRSDNKNGISVYEKVHDVIEKVKNKIDLHINVTITPLNLNIFDTAKYLYEKGVKNIHFYLCDSDRQEMQFRKEHINILKCEYEKICDYILKKMEEGLIITCQPLTDNMKKLHLKQPVFFPCSTLKNRAAFDSDGNMYPCIVLMESNTSFGNINNRIEADKLLYLKKTMLAEKDCDSCWARYLCGGECLSSKLWDNLEQKKLRCSLKRHIFALRIYMYDYIITHKAKYIF